MKQFIFFCCLATFFFQETRAITIIASGCTISRKYSRVTFDHDEVICTGHGSLVCPTGTISTGGSWKIACSPDEIVCFVAREVSNGRASGAVLYNDEVPVSWKMIDGENVKIEIDASGRR